MCASKYHKHCQTAYPVAETLTPIQHCIKIPNPDRFSQINMTETKLWKSTNDFPLLMYMPYFAILRRKM